jgi:hypothetical protein
MMSRLVPGSRFVVSVSLFLALALSGGGGVVGRAATSDPAGEKSAAAPAAGSSPSSSGAKESGSSVGPAAGRPAAGTFRRTATAEASKSGASASGAADPEAEAGEAEADRNEPGEDRRRRVRGSSAEFSLGGSEVVVAKDEELADDAVNIGGRLTIDGVVDGDVVIVGGILKISGTVRGEVVAICSQVTLEDGARILGHTTNVLGKVTRSPEVMTRGGYTSIDALNLGRFATGRGFIAFLLWTMFWLSVVVTAIRFLCVLVVAAVAPHRIEGAVAAPRPNWILAFLLGFVIRLFEVPLTLLLIAPCVTIPVAVALGIIIRIIIWMGLASIALHLGRLVGRTFLNTDFSYFGAILLGYVIIAVIGFVPIIGWIMGGIISSAGLGLMLMTRFGAKKPSAAALL